MKKLILILLIGLNYFSFAQTAQEIIYKNIENTGGIINWKLLNSISLKGKAHLSPQEEYPIKIYQQRPNLTKTVLIINKKENIIQGYDGKKGYGMNYATNELQEFENYQPQSFDTDFIDYEQKGFVANLIGKEKVNDRICFKIELQKNTNKTIYYFDAESYMLLKEIKKEETLIYSNFKNVGNFIMPYKIESLHPKKEGDYTMIFNKIEVNKAFPESTFKIK